MNPMRWIGVVLLVVGVLGLALGSFSFTKKTHEAQIGPIELSLKEQKTVNVPVWAGAGAVAVGLVLIGLGGRKG